MSRVPPLTMKYERTREVNALGDNTIYVYDGNGNMVSKTDADGYVTQYSYTALDLAKKINYNGAKEASYQYNKVGELVQMNDWTGTNTFELDLLGRLQKMTDHKDNTVSYAYDAVGNQTSITYPDGSKVNNFYDAVYNLTSVIDAEKGTYVYVYLGTTDYLTSAVNSKVISWTSYSEWGEITHNAVLKCGQRELDLVKEYATHDFDAVLNMYYAKARFYDADNRRFAAVDPILDPSWYDLREYVTDPMQLVQCLYVKNNAVLLIDELGLKALLPYPGMIHSAVMTHIAMQHPDYYYEQKIDYDGTIFWGRADIISPTGEVWDIKSEGELKGKKRQKAVDQVLKYVNNTWHAYPDIELSVGGPGIEPGSFYVVTRYVDYFVEYKCVGDGLIQYSYEAQADTNTIWNDVRVGLTATGAAIMMIYSGGLAGLGAGAGAGAAALMPLIP